MLQLPCAVLALILCLGRVEASCRLHSAKWKSSSEGPTVTQLSRSDPARVKVDWTDMLDDQRCVDSYVVRVWNSTSPDEAEAVRIPGPDANSLVVGVSPCVENIFQVEFEQNSRWSGNVRRGKSGASRHRTQGFATVKDLGKHQFDVRYLFDVPSGIHDLTKAVVSFNKSAVLNHPDCAGSLRVEARPDAGATGGAFDEGTVTSIRNDLDLTRARGDHPNGRFRNKRATYSYNDRNSVGETGRVFNPNNDNDPNGHYHDDGSYQYTGPNDANPNGNGYYNNDGSFHYNGQGTSPVQVYSDGYGQGRGPVQVYPDNYRQNSRSTANGHYHQDGSFHYTGPNNGNPDNYHYNGQGTRPNQVFTDNYQGNGQGTRPNQVFPDNYQGNGLGTRPNQVYPDNYGQGTRPNQVYPDNGRGARPNMTQGLEDYPNDHFRNKRATYSYNNHNSVGDSGRVFNPNNNDPNGHYHNDGTYHYTGPNNFNPNRNGHYHDDGSFHYNAQGRGPIQVYPDNYGQNSRSNANGHYHPDGSFHYTGRNNGNLDNYNYNGQGTRPNQVFPDNYQDNGQGTRPNQVYPGNGRDMRPFQSTHAKREAEPSGQEEPSHGLSKREATYGRGGTFNSYGGSRKRGSTGGTFNDNYYNGNTQGASGYPYNNNVYGSSGTAYGNNGYGYGSSGTSYGNNGYGYGSSGSTYDPGFGQGSTGSSFSNGYSNNGRPDYGGRYGNGRNDGGGRRNRGKREAKKGGSSGGTLGNNQGGSYSSGGSSGGSFNNGDPTEGSSGGSFNGGYSNGGSSGGSFNGGNSNGGNPNGGSSGGSFNGRNPNGGSSGGSFNGGNPNGGSSGGSFNGGNPNGGNPNGGNPNGGNPNGGNPNGGNPNGGNPNGGNPNSGSSGGSFNSGYSNGGSSGGPFNGGNSNSGNPNGGSSGGSFNSGNPNSGNSNGGNPNGGSSGGSFNGGNPNGGSTGGSFNNRNGNHGGNGGRGKRDASLDGGVMEPPFDEVVRIIVDVRPCQPHSLDLEVRSQQGTLVGAVEGLVLTHIEMQDQLEIPDMVKAFELSERLEPACFKSYLMAVNNQLYINKHNPASCSQEPQNLEV